MPNNVNWAKKIVQLRKKIGKIEGRKRPITWKNLAKLLGCSAPPLYDIRNGHVPGSLITNAILRLEKETKEKIEVKK